MEVKELNKKDLESYQKGQDDLTTFRAQLKIKKDELENKFHEENVELIIKINKLSEELDKEKSKFKEQALDLYLETKQKKLIGGLGIREGTNLVYDEEKAFNWAKEHALCL